MEDDLKRLLKDGAHELGLELTPEAMDGFSLYLKELKVWGEKINLTAVKTDREIIIRHFLDSLTLCAFLKDRQDSSLLDIGSGAGFPGIPVKLVMPELDVLMMDSVAKKVHFMRHVIRTLGLKGIDAISERAEDKAVIKRYAEKFDVVSSRAFAELAAFVMLGLPYCKPGGVMIAMKGPAVTDEFKGLEGINGISAPEAVKVTVPFSDREMVLVRIKKRDL